MDVRQRSTRYGVLISKEVGNTILFLHICCDSNSNGMRQLLSISINAIHSKSKENRIAMDDLLCEALDMHEICVRCPGCICDGENCHHVSLEDLRRERTKACKGYGHSVSFEDVFGGEVKEVEDLKLDPLSPSEELPHHLREMLRIVGDDLKKHEMDRISGLYHVPYKEYKDDGFLLVLFLVKENERFKENPLLKLQHMLSSIGRNDLVDVVKGYEEEKEEN